MLSVLLPSSLTFSSLFHIDLGHVRFYRVPFPTTSGPWGKEENLNLHPLSHIHSQQPHHAIRYLAQYLNPPSPTPQGLLRTTSSGNLIPTETQYFLTGALFLTLLRT